MTNDKPEELAKSVPPHPPSAGMTKDQGRMTNDKPEELDKSVPPPNLFWG